MLIRQERMVSRIRAMLVALAIVASSFMATIVLAMPAQAAVGDILPPFDTGQTWSVCRGYGYASHTGTSNYGIDLTGAGCDNSASGRTVRAPIGGTVVYYQASYGNLCVNMPGGGSYTLTHINSSIASGTLTAGQVVGTVAAPNTRNNAGVSHIHFQMWRSSGCYKDAGIPFDSAHGARICGAPDLTSSGGPSTGNGMWSGTRFTGQTCGSENTTAPEIPSVEESNSVTGDFNGDGKADVAALYNYGGDNTALFVFNGSANGPQAPVRAWLSGPGNWRWENSKLS